MTSISALQNIRDSKSKNELVVVVGTGSSIALTDNSNSALSWLGLIRSGFEFAGVKGKVSAEQIDFWGNQLNSVDIDDILSAAEYVGRKLEGPSGDLYSRWIFESFQNVAATNVDMCSAISGLSSLGIPICTLNYDSLLESVTGLPAVLLSDKRKASAWVRGEERGILHLHGHWEHPESCVLGIRDYEKTLDDEVRDLFQRYLGAFKRLLFIGCGGTFTDPNFTALIRWLRSKIGASQLQHYALVSESQVNDRHSDQAWHGFVDPLSYGSSRTDLPRFISELFPGSGGPAVAGYSQGKRTPKGSKDAKLLSEYKEFLVRDCGQMTIEGVRADMDTAQRRFDLEKLFVPLELSPCPPDISLDDPQRDVKLVVWKKKNKDARPFGEVFEKAKGLALLALPGGGKTLLLKRLAVAYATPDRRLKSNDGLPEIDLTPVLIRCREWRDHINLPIATLLKKLPEITGQPELEGLSGALTPIFKKGKALLLIDGLDEIHDDADRTIFVDHLRAFLDQYPKTKVVVTSREAGFSLVAPYLATHCEQWRLAPLNSQAIMQLCGHWHDLMAGNSPEAVAEAEGVARVIVENVALRRLAENPLLLTMLLVVKHGAGRLPPDRVSLYSRAVEVLLDTWNIRGHDALNMKEAIPQLSYIAYELMRAGQQTATERTLLDLLEKARENVPQIKRYAKDTPYEFLKRVELRSSLLLEAGHQVENGRAVPFYQFRHLTFQEYLAALAIVDGNYNGYDPKYPLKPLVAYLAAEEWKEVVPMSVVLAGKQANIVIKALVQKASVLKRKMDAGQNFKGKQEWLSHRNTLPPVVARLVQSLIEEAQAEPETITEALGLIVYFARGGQSRMDWRALCRGPYAGELFAQAWKLYAPMVFPRETWVRNSYANLAAFRKPSAYWLSDDGRAELLGLCNSVVDEEICLGLMTCVGLMWNSRRPGLRGKLLVDNELVGRFEDLMFIDNAPVVHAALWAWGLNRLNSHRLYASPSVKILSYLKSSFIKTADIDPFAISAFALSGCLGLPRAHWEPRLTSAEVKQLEEFYNLEREDFQYRPKVCVLILAFHSRSIFSDEQICEGLVSVRSHYENLGVERLALLDETIRQIIPYGPDFLNSLENDESCDDDEFSNEELLEEETD